MMFCRSGPVLHAIALAAVMLPGPARSVSAEPAPPVCHADSDVAGTVSALPKVAAVLKPGDTLQVLAVGSATMFGPEASLQPGTLTNLALNNGSSFSLAAPKPINKDASDRAFPRQMATALQAEVPGLKVEVVVRGGRGMSAADMLSTLKNELAAHPYQLVLWQTGTVEAVKNTPPNEFAKVLSEGAEAVEAAGANLILIDPQYSRFLQANSNLDPYTQALQQAGSIPGVLLFHRFDLMHAWATDGQINLERTPKNDRTRVVDALHACLGTSLARMVLAGARA